MKSENQENLENLKLRRLREWAKGNTAPPLSIEIGITDKCNLNCLFCDINHTNNVIDFISHDDWKNIINEAIEMGVKQINLGVGGEPLFNPKKVLSLMKLIKERNVAGSIVTNGTLFNNSMIKTLIEINWNQIIFSIDGGDAETHDYLRNQKNVFERVHTSLKMFDWWKKKLNKKQPYIFFNTLICNKNYKNLNKIIKLAHDVDCKKINFIALIVMNTEGKKLKLNNIEINKLKKEIPNLIKQSKVLDIKTNIKDYMQENLTIDSTNTKKIIMDYPKSDNNFISLPCFEPWWNMVLLPNGTVGPCFQQDFMKPHLKKYSLKEIWYKKFNKYRKVLSKRNLFEDCSRCCEPIIIRNKSIRNNLKDITRV